MKGSDWLWTALLALIACGGCGPGNLATIQGRVLLDGSPLACSDESIGTIVFQREGGGPKVTASIDSSGRYSAAAGSSARVEPGEYVVSVTAKEMLPSEDPNYPPKMRSLIPARYATARTSELKFTVTSGSNQIDLELTSG